MAGTPLPQARSNRATPRMHLAQDRPSIALPVSPSPRHQPPDLAGCRRDAWTLCLLRIACRTCGCSTTLCPRGHCVVAESRPPASCQQAARGCPCTARPLLGSTLRTSRASCRHVPHSQSFQYAAAGFAACSAARAPSSWLLQAPAMPGRRQFLVKSLQTNRDGVSTARKADEERKADELGRQNPSL